MAWQVVAEHAPRSPHGRTGRKKIVFKSRPVAVPRGMDEPCGGLPVDLLLQWAAWGFRQWPGRRWSSSCPPAAGARERLVERARPVVELAVGTWVLSPGWTPPWASRRTLGEAAPQCLRRRRGAPGHGGSRTPWPWPASSGPTARGHGANGPLRGAGPRVGPGGARRLSLTLSGDGGRASRGSSVLGGSADQIVGAGGSTV